MRVLALGFGGIGTQDHQRDMYLPAFVAHPAFELVGTADTDGTDGAAKAAGEYGVRHFTDLDEALNAADVVSLAAPLAGRAAVLEQVVRAGKHVLADKPLTATLAEARTVAALAAEHGVVVVPAHHQRLGGALRTARAAVRGGRVGLPWNVQADLVVAGGDPAPSGELVNLALYPIDAVLTLLGLAVHRVHAVGDHDLVTVLMDHEHGVTSTVVCGRTAAVGDLPPGGIAVHRYRVSGTHGVLAVDATRPALRLQAASGTSRRWTGPSTVDGLLDVLAAGIRTGRPEIGPADAVAVQAIVEAATQSLHRGEPAEVGNV